MVRNALVPALQTFQLPEAPNVAALTNPLMQGLQSYRQGMQQQFDGDRALSAERRANRSEARADETLRLQKEKMEVERLGKLAQVVADDPDETRSAATWQRILQSNQSMPTLLQRYGVDPRDHRTGAKFLMAEIGAYKSPQEREAERVKLDQTRAQTDVARAQADFYRTRAGALTAQNQPAAAAPAADPLQGAGMDEDGNIVLPQGGRTPAPAYGPGDGSTTFGVPAYQQQSGIMPPPMRLGGPRDDIDASMRLDEGRPASRGTQVAQAGGGGYVPVSQMEQARARMFGTAGTTSPDVPGIITDAGRNRRMDVPATREAQGQRAFDQAAPEQQQRLMKFRQDQELWTGVYKRPPRAGYYYGSDGREMALTDKNFKGDREVQATALLNMKKLEQASKKLLDTFYPKQMVAGYMNIGEVGRAIQDMKQAALGIAYALSGKTVAVAEMKNFMDAYGPTPFDVNETIKAKTERMMQFYNALLAASRGGENYEKALQTAMAAMGVKNPDGTPVGLPAVASQTGQPVKNDLSGVSTEDLIRQLNGGR